LNSRQPEVMTPTYDRLSKSMLKAAVLIAAARMEGDEPEVTVDDMLRAIYYGEQWKTYVEDVMMNIGKGQTERLLQNVYNSIERHSGITRSILMQNFHLSARDASQIFETLEQRGLIIARRQGRGTTYVTAGRGYKNG
jgi:ribosomal protein S25